jgi:hypothetical protein
MEENPYRPPKTKPTKKEIRSFKLCGTGIGLGLVAVSLLLPFTYLVGSVFLGGLFSRVSNVIYIIMACLILYLVISRVCRTDKDFE